MPTTIVGIGDSLMMLGNFLEPFAHLQGWTPTNKGVSGDTTTMMAARFAADVVALAPNYCLFNGGINDVGLGTVTEAQHLANWGSMLSSCQANNIIAIVILITPRSTSNTDVQAAQTDTWIADLRVQIAGSSYANNTHLINLRPLLGQFRATGPVNNFWDYQSRYSDDGVHLNAFGAAVSGLEIQRQFLGLTAPMSNTRQLLAGDLLPTMGVAAPTLTNFNFANATDQVEVIFQVPDDVGANTVTITRLGYMLSGITGTCPVMQISLQGVDASGNPDGTIKGGASPASATFTPAGASTFFWQNLNNAYVANRGDWLAWVFSYSSGTINASNRPIILSSIANTNNQHPYAIGNTAGTRVRVAASIPLWGFGSAGKAFGFPVQGVTATAFSTTNERALRFMLPAGSCGSYKVIGMRALLTSPAAGKSTKIILYDGTTALQTVTWDSDFVSANTQVRPVTLYFQDAALSTLVPGHEYRIGVQPQDASNNVVLHQWDFNSANDLEALSGGMDWYLSTRASGGATAWTDVLTSRPWAALILSDITAPSSGIIMATG
jgi:lysophospholipase L1-like esterase